MVSKQPQIVEEARKRTNDTLDLLEKSKNNRSRIKEQLEAEIQQLNQLQDTLGKQTSKQTSKQTNKQASKEMDKYTNKQTNIVVIYVYLAQMMKFKGQQNSLLDQVLPYMVISK